MSAVFFISFAGGCIMFVLGLFRIVFNSGAAMVKGDGKSASRKRKTRGVWKHWLITAGLFVIAALTQFAF